MSLSPVSAVDCRDLRVPLGDGVELSADLYPVPSGLPAPVVVMFTPYLKGDVSPLLLQVPALTEAGMNVVVVDIRGTGDSGGVFQGPLSVQEASDGAEVVQWLAKQEWSTGRVGLAGFSYPGAIQLLIAARRPEGLACIAPGTAPIDFYRDWTHRGAIPSHTNWAAMAFLHFGQKPEYASAALDFYYGAAQAAEDGPEFWQRSPSGVLADIEVPIMFIGGLYDYFARATLRGFDAATSPKRLVLGPWGHQYPQDPTELVDWYRYWLLDEGTDPTSSANVAVWRIGTEEWCFTTGRSIPAAPTVVSVGRTTIPVRATQFGWPLTVTPSPVDISMDMSTPSGMHLWGEDIVLELGHVAGDIEGAPLVRMRVTAEGCTDADVYTRLSLEHPDGWIEQLTEGRLRLSHRAIDTEKSARYQDGSLESLHHTHVDPQPLPGHSVEVLIEMLPTSVRVPEGGQLLLGVSAKRIDGVSRSAVITADELAIALPVLDVSTLD